MITITWEKEATRHQLSGEIEYWKVGTWYLDGVAVGPIETPCNSNFEQTFTDEYLIEMLGVEKP